MMRTRTTAIAIGLAAFLLMAASGGGRIDIPEGATLAGRDGRFYTKNAGGQALLALPLVALGEGAATLAHLPPERHTLAVRFVTSFFNAAVVALLLAAFYAAARRFGVTAGAALATTAMLGFTTPLWVYGKSFMAEPLESLGLLLALSGASFADEPRWRRLGAVGVALAVASKLSMLPFALVALLPLRVRPWKDRTPFLMALGVVLIAHLAYNFARFGTALESGYGAQATPNAYTTPLWVGLYGLLLSSGKGAMWFAPMLWLAPFGWSRLHKTVQEPKAMPAPARRVAGTIASWLPKWLRPSLSEPVPERRFEELRRAAPAIAGMWALALVLYGMFQHWAGDGSFGPRYLVPFLALAALLVANAVQHPSRVRRRMAQALALVGLLVQLGGVAVHFGAQMREAGDYPYSRALDDPRFMSDSHFNPAFSPIRGHWRMLTRNLGEHLRGEMPRLTLAAPAQTDSAAASLGVSRNQADQRIGIGADDQQRLLHALDFWWLYLAYAGFAAVPLQALAALLAALGLSQALRARAAAAREAR